MDISTTYLGLPLRNPIVVGSSGLTATVDGVKRLSEMGAGAVVLKSLFQEEITFETEKAVSEARNNDGSVAWFDYDGRQTPMEFYGYKVKEENVKRYTTLITQSRESVAIPVIASINCTNDSLEWLSFAKEVERAGAHALELNMFFPPSRFGQTPEQKEALYFKVIAQILKTVTIPVALKISYYFTDLGPMIKRLSSSGINGLVLFNRFFSPDFDITKLEVTPSHLFSTPSEMSLPLRWIAMMANKSSCELIASTGIHDGESVVKQILAGAQAVQVVSTLYKNGVKNLPVMLETLKTWMGSKGIKTVSDFRGRLAQESTSDPGVYERAQFMKYFTDKKRVKAL